MTKNDALKDIKEHEEYLKAKDSTKVFMRSWLPHRKSSTLFSLSTVNVRIPSFTANWRPH